MNVIVLCELEWVLASAYDADEHEVRRLLDQLPRTRQFQIGRRDQVRKALQVHSESIAGFAVCRLEQLNQASGCTQTVTFDQDAAEMQDWRELGG